MKFTSSLAMLGSFLSLESLTTNVTDHEQIPLVDTFGQSTWLDVNSTKDCSAVRIAEFLTRLPTNLNQTARASLEAIYDRNLPEGVNCNEPGSLYADLSAAQTAELACKAAEKIFSPASHYVDALSGGFTERVRINWSQDCWKVPRCILTPSSAEEVSIAVQLLGFSNAKFAIRSGGHNPNPGWAGIEEDGLLIDLAHLDARELSPDRKTMKVGTGNRWVRVYEVLDGTGLTVLGGRVPDVGVGGLIIGGGIPNFSSLYGLACDYVSAFTVVLSSGETVRADKTTNSDLSWALKGGGPNFGIVTDFELETIPVDKIWYEARIYDPAQNDRLLEAVFAYQQAAENDHRSSFAFSLSNNHTLVAFVYAEPVEHPEVFRMFYDIPWLKSFIDPAIGTPFTLVKAFENVLGDVVPFKRDIISVSTKPSLELYRESYKKWLEISSRMHEEIGAMMTFGIQPVTNATISASLRMGETPMKLLREPQHWFTSVIQWREDRDNEAAHTAIRQSGGAIHDIAKRMGILLDFHFMNDATFDQDPISSYGEENVKRLQKVAQKYDPDGFFQRLQGDGFLLRKVASARN